MKVQQKRQREILYKIRLADETGTKYSTRIKSRIFNFASTLSTYKGEIEVVYDPCCSNKGTFETLTQLRDFITVNTEQALMTFLKKHPCEGEV